MTAQTVNIDAYAYTGTLLANLRDPDNLSSLIATASSVVASGVVASRMVCTFSPTLVPAGDYFLEFIVNGVSYSLYVRLTGVDGEVVRATNEPTIATSNAWTQEQVDYAVAQLGLLTLSGSTVVIPSGELMCTRGDVEQVFGTTSVAAWADLNNTGDADDIAGRINYRIAMADNYVRSVLAGGPWNMPEPGDIIPAILAYNVAALTGVYLYEARGIQDYNAAGHAQHQLSYHKKNVEDFLKGVLVGTINLKPLTYSIMSAAPEAS